MSGVIAELTNLANGSEASGDGLAANICRDAIKEIERLQAHENEVWDEVVKVCGGGDWSEYPTELIVNIINKRDDLQAIVDKFPKTEDNVPITEGTVTYCDDPVSMPHRWAIRDKHGKSFAEHYARRPERHYSTRAAAEAAKEPS